MSQLKVCLPFDPLFIPLLTPKLASFQFLALLSGKLLYTFPCWICLALTASDDVLLLNRSLKE